MRKSRWIVAPAALSLSVILAASAARGDVACQQPAKSPGNPYVERGVCPGECCTYREWTARAPVDVVAEPDSKRVVGHLAAGDKVTAETGEVHVTPLQGCVLRDHPLANPARPDEKPVILERGQTVWVLAPRGEGYATLWVDGMLYAAEALWTAAEFCKSRRDDEAYCWAKVVGPASAVDAWWHHRWWVRVRTSTGVQGWVDNTNDVLSGFDAC